MSDALTWRKKVDNNVNEQILEGPNLSCFAGDLTAV